MSRHLPSFQRPHVYQSTSDNPYQVTTLSTTTFPVAHMYNQQKNTESEYTKDNFRCFHNSSRRGVCNNVATFDTGVSDDTCTETNSYYNCPNYGYQHLPKTESRNTDCMFSDDSDTKPYHEIDAISSKRFSRQCSNHSFNKRRNFYRDSSYKDARKIYPNRENTQTRSTNIEGVTHTVVSLPLGSSRLSDRPQSSLSSGVTSAVVDGCGGHCQTFENVFYYFLQVAFTMGILIGTSLSIAGAVLRKSAARNLSVLVYIGALLSMVSALLLAIQCSARCNARKRKKALRNAKRAPIPLDTLYTRPAVTLQQQPLIEEHNQRGFPVLHLQVPQSGVQQKSSLSEQQGIPWWRRKDLNRL